MLLIAYSSSRAPSQEILLLCREIAEYWSWLADQE